jgi:hypothetical protein
VLIFLGLVAFIFWLGGLAEKPVLATLPKSVSPVAPPAGPGLQPAHGD